MPRGFEAMGDDDGLSLWGRILIGAHIWIIGAVIGGIWAGSWSGAITGLFVATPFAMLTLIAPGAMLCVLEVLSLFSCAG